VVVFHRGRLTPQDKAVVDWLEKCASGDELYANLVVQTVDLAKQTEKSMHTLWAAQSEPELPWTVVRYPEGLEIEESAWSGRLSVKAAKALVDSPARREGARRIVEGESAVWVLLEIGDQKKDDAAAKLLKAQLKKMSDTLELPQPLPVWGDPEYQEGDAEQKPPLRASFSMVRVRRSDPAEALFVSMLLHTEPDLKTLSEPMAFAIFGRARTLPALVGAGINEENIAYACAFLVGPCACQIKALNPGLDLLFAADWEAALDGREVEAPELPPLRGLSALAAAAKPAPNPAPAPPLPARVETPATSRASGHLLRNILLAAAIGIAISAAAAIALTRKRTSRRS